MALLSLLALLFLAGCDRQRGPATAVETAPKAAASPAARAHRPDHLFTETTGALGFIQDPPIYPDGTFQVPEITPGAVAVCDFDNDGRLDILAVPHPAPAPWEEQKNARVPNRLFHQEPDGRFKEVAGAAGLAGSAFHHGVAIGDVNNDGWADVYVCNFGGPDEFFLNKGDGTFTDVSEKAGFRDGGPGGEKDALLTSPFNWSSTASFFDFDGDGDLDLWVAHFATFDPLKKCKGSASAEEFDYCGPHTFSGQLATLWRNNGDGTFSNVTRKSGIDAPGRGWGIVAADLTGDGFADVLQANDEEPNQLWVNQGDGTFVDEALLRGSALNAFGSVEANMGVAVGDVRNRGRGHHDILMTHISGETNTLWQAAGDGTYQDATAGAGMGLVDRPFTGWGAGFFDADNDGFLDLAIVNGRVARGPVRPEANVGPFWNRFAEPCIFFRGDGTGRFSDASAAAGDFPRKLEVHRALAFGDLHNRGAVDLITMNLDNTLRVFRNDAAPPEHHWLQVLPIIGKREALGAQVEVSAGGRKRAAFCLRNYSYLACSDPRVHFGLGKADKADSVKITWPSGTPRHEAFEANGVDRVLVARQGEGKAL